MADAVEGRFNKHVAGGAWADWFFEADKFAEVVLVMDCCRDYHHGIRLNQAFDEVLATGRDQRTRYYVYGAKWGTGSFERMMEDGRVHGVLSRALLDGLKGHACDPETGEVTGATLRTFLAKYMVEYMTPVDQANANLSHSPDIPTPDDPAKPALVLASIPINAVPTLSVNLTLPATAMGATLEIRQIRDGNVAVVQTMNIQSTDVALSLKIGKYFAQVDGGAGIKKPFEVRGIRGVNVTL